MTLRDLVRRKSMATSNVCLRFAVVGARSSEARRLLRVGS